MEMMPTEISRSSAWGAALESSGAAPKGVFAAPIVEDAAELPN